MSEHTSIEEVLIQTVARGYVKDMTCSELARSVVDDLRDYGYTIKKEEENV